MTRPAAWPRRRPDDRRCKATGALRLLWLFALSGVVCSGQAAATDAACSTGASPACYFSLPLGHDGGGATGSFHYYASAAPGASLAPTAALVAIHGHSRDANKTFDAALKTVDQAGGLAETLIVAPVFQVAAARTAKCRTDGVPDAAPGDLLWTCGSWAQGDPATNDPGTTSFAALDALLQALVHQWPSLRTITVAGFSAGGQTVQHYLGFAAALPGVALRYVVADPGSWLYFDPVRAQPQQAGVTVDWSACAAGDDPLGTCTLTPLPLAPTCAEADRWKYGTRQLPATLGRSAAEARAVYAAADISYLEGALDSAAGRGTAYRVLDRSCGAMAQGPFRLQRGLAYGAYDRAVLAPQQARPVVVVPGCAHDVACVFPSAAARAALLGPGH